MQRRGRRPSISGERVRLIIVDDHQMLLEGTKAALRQYPELEIVGTASTGGEALRQLEELQPDLILLDIRLPDISGVEVARVAHERWPNILVVVLSGFDDMLYLRSLRKIGVRACLSKTLTTSELREALRKVIAGEMPPDSRSTPAEQMDAFTPREFQVLQEMRRGLRNSEIGDALGLSIKAVEYHITHILEKLEARSRSEAIVKVERLMKLRDEQEATTAGKAPDGIEDPPRRSG